MFRRLLGLSIGLALFVLLIALDGPLGPAGSPAACAAATGALMVAWWATEALPLWVTALAPLVVFPLGGVHPGGPARAVLDAASPYVDAYVLLFLGGMAIAAGLQETGLHRRIAAAVLRRVGGSPRRLIAGVMLASASLSLWISNTASAALILPIALALLAEIEAAAGRRPRYAAALILAVAWGANVGGIGTKIGTATNAQFAGFMGLAGIEISFVQFSLVGGGFVLLLMPIAWWFLWRVGRADAPGPEHLRGIVGAELGAPAPWSAGERAVLAVFAGTAATWILAQPIRDALAALQPQLALRTAHVEAGTALLAGLILLVWRPRGTPLVSARSLRAMPVSALLLIGGSFALASGLESSGLSAAAAPGLTRLADLPPLLQSVTASLATVGISAFASNTATIGILLPILSAAIPDAREMVVLFAATIASSCDFMLPAGTPPNAIAFGSGRVPFATMVRAGVMLDVVAGVLAAVWCEIAVPLVLG